MSQHLLIYYASENGMLRHHHGITLEMNAVLLTMLEHSNPETHLVSVGIPRLMKTTSLHGRSVQRAIEQLIASGAIIPLPKVKYGRSWVNAYRPNLLGMPKPSNDAHDDAHDDADADADPSAHACAHDVAHACADDDADDDAFEGSDADAVERKRENVFPQQPNASDLLRQDLQPEPKSKPKTKSKPELEKPTLEELFGHVLDLAVERSLKELPPKKPAGEALKITIRKRMMSQLLLIIDSLDGFRFVAKSYRSEALAELLQCQADGIDVHPQTKEVIFPSAAINLSSPFKQIN
tara:strand:+ start:2291 stop:3172 length:882 start_codon:yes stop_codon:yes gene_type:complete